MTQRKITQRNKEVDVKREDHRYEVQTYDKKRPQDYIPYSVCVYNVTLNGVSIKGHPMLTEGQ